MKYFVITVDKNFVPPVPIGWYGKIDRKTWKGKKAHEKRASHKETFAKT